MLEIVFRYDPERTDPQERPANADQALAALARGNEQFARLWGREGDPSPEVIPFDGRLWGLGGQPGELPKQEPFAAVLACSDARVPTELVFHRTLNDLFVVRLAGNVISNEGVGSLAFAARALEASLRLVVVLGHMGCGAVTAAVDVYLSPSSYPDVTRDIGLRSIVDPIFGAVRLAATTMDADGPDYRQRMIGSSVVLNAAMTAMAVGQLLGDAISSECRVVFGVHDPANGMVSAPGGDGAQLMQPGLAAPPSDSDALEWLARQLADRPLQDSRL